MAIYQDVHENYWFGSWDDGLYRYDGNSIYHFSEKDGFPETRIEEIKESKAGVLFVNTPNGVYRYDNGHFQQLKVNSFRVNDWENAEGELWFKQGWDDGAVYRSNGKQLFTLRLPQSPIIEPYLEKHGLNKESLVARRLHSVYTIYMDENNNPWFGTAAIGVVHFDGKELRNITEQDVIEMHDGPSNGVRSILKRTDGKYLLGNNLYTYHILDNKHGEFQYVRNQNIPEAPEAVSEYLSSAIDKEGNIWFVTYLNGVYRFDGKKYDHFEIIENGQQIEIFYVYVDRVGEIWLGTHKNGVYKFDGRNFQKELINSR